MAAIWADFPSGQIGLYGATTSSMLNGIYAEIMDPAGVQGAPALVNDPDSNVGAAGKVLRVGSIGTNYSSPNVKGVRYALPVPGKTIGTGMRIWLPSLPTTNTSNPIISYRNVGNSSLFAIRILSTGAIEARSGETSSNTLYGVTSGPVLVANAYNHLEVKGFSNATTGTIEIRVNGDTVLSLTGLNTNGADIAQMVWGVYNEAGLAISSQIYFKDLIVWDTTGSEVNDFQGSVAVRDLYTDADISLNWTPSTGTTGWDLLDKTAVDDSTYISAASPAPSPAVFSLTNLPDDVTSVRALLPIVRSVKTDGGDCNIQIGLTPNNTNWDDGTDRPITTAYTFRWDVSEVSPDTALPWTPVEVNDAYIRINRTL